MTDRYAVFGNPISHSRSPLIHSLFARQQDQLLSYVAEQIEATAFESSVQAFFQAGGKGLNITLPFKERAFALAQQVSERAQVAAAANTLWQDEQGQVCADNTDGIGLVTDLQHNHGISLQGARVLLLGAGGAVRGVVQPLLDAGCAQVFIANRTPERAQALQALFEQRGERRVEGGGYDQVPATAFDLIINGTSASLQGDIPPIAATAVSAHTQAYDMMYAAVQTPFCRWALTQGAARAVDGLGMLVEQAAEAFLIWRGVRPDTAPVIELLRQNLAQQ